MQHFRATLLNKTIISDYVDFMLHIKLPRTLHKSAQIMIQFSNYIIVDETDIFDSLKSNYYFIQELCFILLPIWILVLHFFLLANFDLFFIKIFSV